MLKPELSPDVFSVVLDHVNDSQTLYSLVRSWLPGSPYRALAMRERFKLPIVLTVGSPEYTSKLVNLLFDLPEVAALIRNLHVACGPSSNSSWGEVTNTFPSPEDTLFPFDIQYESEKDDHRRNYGLRVVASKKLSQVLPHLLALMPNLTEMTWTRCPAPSPEILKALSLIDCFNSLSVDCASGEWTGRGMDEEDEYWDITPFFSSVGPQLLHLDLRNVSEGTYKVVLSNAHLLKSLVHLRIDITCGVWDWEGGGSPQVGASEAYKFEPIPWSESLRSATLVTTDLAMSSATGGPLRMFESVKLTKLVLDIQPCFGWIVIQCVRTFQGLYDGNMYPALEHLVILDGLMGWDESSKVIWDEQSSREMDPRYYLNIHHFLATLPRLRKLWVNDWVLGVLKNPPDQDSWSGNEGKLFPASETWNTDEWMEVRPALQRLDSLRIGLGAINDSTVSETLGCCNRDILSQIGFEYDWKAYGRMDPISPEVLRHLSRFKRLKHVHILYPRPWTKEYEPEYDYREQTDTLDVVRSILSACPSVVQVGIGKNAVWERKTPGPGIQRVGYVKNLQGFFNFGWNADEDEGSAMAEGDDLEVDPVDDRNLVAMLRAAVRARDGEPKSISS